MGTARGHAHRDRLADQGARGHDLAGRTAAPARLFGGAARLGALGSGQRPLSRDCGAADRLRHRRHLRAGRRRRSSGRPLRQRLIAPGPARIARTSLRPNGYHRLPQSHPNIDDDVTVQSMWDKRQYATYIAATSASIPRRSSIGCNGYGLGGSLCRSTSD